MVPTLIYMLQIGARHFYSLYIIEESWFRITVILGANLTGLDNLIEGRRKDVEGPTFLMNPDKVGHISATFLTPTKPLPELRGFICLSPDSS